MGSSSTSPYRDETHGMALKCAELEEEVRTLRRSIRKLSAKTAVCSRCARRQRPWRRQPSYIAKLVALLVTVLLTCAGCAVRRKSHGCTYGAKQPAKKTAFEQTLLGFAGLR